MKQSKECIKVLHNDDKDEFIWSNFSTIKSFEPLNDTQFKIYLDKTDDTVNYGQIGVSILSYSKRIVNEVMDVANDHNINIYYTDTDSLHITKAGLPTLKSEYMKIHNRDLDGKKLGQFHTDFNLEISRLKDCLEVNKKLDIGCKDVTAYKSCFIGKKLYCDMLKGTDYTTGNVMYGHHIRIKGVTKEGIKHKITEYDGDAFKIFENLASGLNEKFILNPKDKVLFEYSTTGVYTKQEPFYRTL